MRKTLIALIIVLPVTFVLVIFSSLNLVALNVPVAVNGITIRAEDEVDGALFVNMAEEKDHFVSVEVSPANATEKGYNITCEPADILSVTQEGKIVPRREGTAKITATSVDKGFSDTMSVVVGSSLPYDFTFSLFDEEGNNVLEETLGGYTGSLSTGTYTYAVDIAPAEFTAYTYSVANGTVAEFSQGLKTVYLPFSGKAEFTVTVPNGVKGPISKTVSLDVTGASSDVLVNGQAASEFAKNSVIPLAFGARRAQFYVECEGGEPRFSSGDVKTECDVTSYGSNRYLMEITLLEDAEEGFSAQITAGGKIIDVTFTFEDFAFSLRSDASITEKDGSLRTAVITGQETAFYAVSSVDSEDVAYRWELSGAPAEYLTASGSSAILKAGRSGQYTLRVTATVAGSEPLTETLLITAVDNVADVLINNDTRVDLAECYTIAGKAYDNAYALVSNAYALTVYSFDSNMSPHIAGDEIVYSVNNDSIATVDVREGIPYVIPKASGKVEVTASWTGNEYFPKKVTSSVTFNIIADAVSVKNAPELVTATKAGLPVVLTTDIKLGTDAHGELLSKDERAKMFGTMKSTYNIEWYKHAASASESDATVSFVMEFTNDVYGNGKSIDADNFTHAFDSTGQQPLFSCYRRPLYFVRYGDTASVAGQDNCAFLIRKDGVRLYGVNLLGCSDDSLTSESGVYDLNNLNATGTTLEVNASAEIINCRIRNGRNVVRVYGGNRDGSKYFLESLGANTGCDSERIQVRIEGCILSQGREFILKAGANRALHASLTNGAEPVLRDKDGKPYPSTTATSNSYTDPWMDEDFYKNYVMTDITLKDSVLETSGLFTVGIEANFAGQLLYPGTKSADYQNLVSLTKEWQYSGGTSFAVLLRLEGDVRLYDWKDITLVDSSTLIESPIGGKMGLEWLKLDIAKMLNYVSKLNPEAYGKVIQEADGKQFVHGGIALYGGGRNYSCVDYSKLDEARSDFLSLNVNISVLKGGGADIGKQGSLLPAAAGTQDFRFYMYGSDSVHNNYVSQLTGKNYGGVKPIPVFE